MSLESTNSAAARWVAPATFALLLSSLAGCTFDDTTPSVSTVESAIRLPSSPSDSAVKPSSTATPSGSQTGSASPTNSPSTGSTTDDDYVSEDSDSTSANAVFDGNAELKIEDQSGDGRSVVISEFDISIDNVWLVIRTEAGRVLVARLTNARSKPVTITLATPITSSQELVAHLYLDDGDGLFESVQDAPVYEEIGELIDEHFDYEYVG